MTTPYVVVLWRVFGWLPKRSSLFCLLLGLPFVVSVHPAHARQIANKQGTHLQEVVASERSLRQPAVLGARQRSGLRSPIHESLSSVPAPANALGDLNADGVADLIDLLRLRDLTYGFGSPAEPLELQKADMNADGEVDSADATYLRRVLLGEVPLPFRIDELGGIVRGNDGRTEIVIPPGLFTGGRVFTIEDVPQKDVEDVFGMPLPDGMSLMAGAKLSLLNPAPGDYLPSTIQLSEVVDDTTVFQEPGRNVMYNLAPDQDGSGAPDLIEFGDLMIDRENDRMRFVRIPTISLAEIRVGTTSYSPSETIDLYSGDHVEVYGSGWQSIFETDYEAFACSSSDTLRLDVIEFTETPERISDISGLRLRIGFLSVGDWNLLVRCAASGAISDEAHLRVLQPPLLGAAARDSALVYLGVLDSLLGLAHSDPDFRDIALEHGRDLEEERANFTAFVDSLRTAVTINERFLSDVVDYLSRRGIVDLLSTGVEAALTLGACSNTSYAVCIECCRDQHKTRRAVCDETFTACNILGIAETINSGSTMTSAMCLLDREDCYELAKRLRMRCERECCPNDEFVRCGAFVANPQKRNIEWQFLCFHLKWDAIKVRMRCVAGCEVCNRILALGCPGGLQPCAFQGNLPAVRSQGGGSVDQRPPIGGLRVRVVGATIPLSEGTIAPNGIGSIPINLLSGNVVLAGYDPFTGLFDDTVATVEIDDPTNSRTFAEIYFDPNRTTVQFPLELGSVVNGVVTPEIPNQEWLLNVKAAEVGFQLNLGMRGSAPLSVIVEDPSGTQRFNNEGLDGCVNVMDMPLLEAGTYTVKVGRGGAGQFGEYVLGARVDGGPPTAYICGDFGWVLDASRTPYVVADPAFIATGREVEVRSGVRIEFESGGRVVSNGRLVGDGRPDAPIILGARETAIAGGSVGGRR